MQFRNSLVAMFGGLSMALSLSSDARAQCTPVENCQVTSTTWFETIGCPTSPGTRSTSRGSETELFGELVKSLHVLRGLQAVLVSSVGLKANSESTFPDCYIESDEPFERITAGTCEEAVKHRMTNTFCVD
jgi:hypothetical protein